MKRTLIPLVIVFTASLGSGGDKKESLSWSSFDNGITEAKTNDKKILVDVYTDWCGWCKRMDKDVYANDDVAKYLAQHFILVKVNAESDEQLHYKGKTYSEMELAQGFRVTGYPTILFLKPDGDHITTLPGYVKAEEFLNILKFIGEDYYKTMKWAEYTKSLNNKGTGEKEE